MEMKTIEIYGFEGITKSILYPQKINLLLGENGAGKSSTLRAIRYALTGEHGDHFINMHVASCRVVIEFTNGIIISRETTPNAKGAMVTKCRMNGKATTAKSITEFLTQEGYDSASLKLMTAGDIANALPDSEGLAEYILSQLNMNLSFESIVKHAGKINSKTVELMRRYFPEGNFSIDKITEVHDTIKTERTILNRKLKEHQAKAVFHGITPGRTEAEIQRDLNEILKVEASKDAVTEAYVSYQQALAARNKILAEIKAQEELYDAMEVVRPNPAQKEKVEKEIENLKKQAANLTRMETTLLQNIEMYETTLDNLSSNCCPLSEKLVCKTDKNEIKGELQELKQRNKEELNLVRDSISTNKIRMETEEKKLNDFTKGEAAYQKKLNICSKITLLKSNLPQVPIKPAKPPEEETKNEDFSKKKILENEKKNLEDYKYAKKEKQKADSLQADIDIYTDAINFLSPKEAGGIKEKILMSALSAFVSHCQDRARQLNFPFTLQLHCKKGLEFYCEDKYGKSIPVRKASEGEQIHLVFLILDMINQLTNTKFLIIDNFNHMDKANFESLIRLLQRKEVADEYEHIFVAQLPFQEIQDYLENKQKLNVISM